MGILDTMMNKNYLTLKNFKENRKQLQILKEEVPCYGIKEREIKEIDNLLTKINDLIENWNTYERASFSIHDFPDSPAVNNDPSLRNKAEIFNNKNTLSEEYESIIKKYVRLEKQASIDKEGYKDLPHHIDTARRNLLVVSIISAIFIYYHGKVASLSGVKFAIPKHDVLVIFIILQLYFGLRFLVFLIESDLEVFSKKEWRQFIRNITKWNDITKKIVFRVFNFYIPLGIAIVSFGYAIYKLYKLIHSSS